MTNWKCLADHRPPDHRVFVKRIVNPNENWIVYDYAFFYHPHDEIPRKYKEGFWQFSTDYSSRDIVEFWNDIWHPERIFWIDPEELE